MSHLKSNEKQNEASYTAVEMNNQSESSRRNCFSLNNIIHLIQRDWNENGKVKLIIAACGIFISFLAVGILQEQIMRGKYINEDNTIEKFKFPNTLIGVQFIFSFIFIKALDIAYPEEKPDKTHFLYYAIAACVNAGAMVSSYTALRWVSYPMQVIFKSAKPLSVMSIGLLFCKRYPLRRYFFVLIIVAGVVIFKYFEPKDTKKTKESPKNGTESNNITIPTLSSVEKKPDDDVDYALIGTLLLILSLILDGILGAVQDRIRATSAPSSRKFMLGMSTYAAIFLTAIVIVTGETVDVYHFICRHPEILWHIGVFATCGVSGQMFIFLMVASFGSLACSVTTTVRKFFSVLFSIVFFGNPSTLLQWVGAIFVFGGLFADAFFGKKHSRPSQNVTEMTEKAETTERLVENPEQTPTIAKNNSNGQQTV